MRTVTAAFQTAVQVSHQLATSAEIIDGGDGTETTVAIVDGTVTLDQQAAVRGRCDVTIVEDDDNPLGLVPDSASSLLAPYGNEIRLSRGVAYPDGTTELVSLGVFRIQDAEVTDDPAGMQIRISGLDRAQRFIDAQFEEPYQVAAGTNFATAILSLLQAAWPAVPTSFTATALTTPQLIAQEGEDRWAFAQGMAKAISMSLYFDGDGTCILAPDTTSDPVVTLAETVSTVTVGARAVNLVTTPSFEAGVGAWFTTAGGNSIIAGATLTTVTGTAPAGSNYARVVTAATTFQGAEINLGNLQAGTQYAVSVQLRRNAGGSSLQAWVRENFGSFTIYALNVAGVNTAFQTFTTTFTAAVSGPHHFAIRIDSASVTTFEFDAVLVAEGTDSTYFDGDTPGYGWAGTPHASASGPPFVHVETEDGVLLTAGRRWTREGTFNRVIATGENTGETAPARGVATDDNPLSPTYYYGPFGKVPRFYPSPFLTTDAQAAAAAASILAKELGTSEQVNFGTLVLPHLEPGDVARITRARAGVDEDHIIDQLTIPLAATGSMSGQTRARQVTS